LLSGESVPSSQSRVNICRNTAVVVMTFAIQIELHTLVVLCVVVILGLNRIIGVQGKRVTGSLLDSLEGFTFS
jgi:hypothetical protein